VLLTITTTGAQAAEVGQMSGGQAAGVRQASGAQANDAAQASGGQAADVRQASSGQAAEESLARSAWPATDLGYLLHKHPGRVQALELSSGVAHVFYPEATSAKCTAALLLEVDPVGLVRGRRGPEGGEGFSLGQYVNDRPYAASSLLAVAISRVFKTAMAGRCEARPELAASAIPLELAVPVLPCRGGADLARRLFEPLGWRVAATPIGLDDAFPAWGDSRYLDLRLSGRLRLADALNHLYVLLPVLDDSKHYWVSTDEVDKLVRVGGGWLAGHPQRELITRRYLAHRSSLYRSALARLAEVDDVEPESFDNAVPESGQVPGTQLSAADAVDSPIPLAEQRRGAVLAVLRSIGAGRVGDMGCGEGALTAALIDDPAFTEVIAADVASRALEVTERRLRLDRMPARKRERLRMIQSSLTYRDRRLAGLDALVLMEVIEHIDLPRLGALERNVFGASAPAHVVVTTPNSEYNVKFTSLAPGQPRHRDHRFEWSRAEFAAWAERVAAGHGYDVRFLPVGDEDPQLGPPTQMAVFSRRQPRPEVASTQPGQVGA
jgi:3' terminal RNA ribose 2'-O-methyltransferase Hen1